MASSTQATQAVRLSITSINKYEDTTNDFAYLSKDNIKSVRIYISSVICWQFMS